MKFASLLRYKIEKILLPNVYYHAFAPTGRKHTFSLPRAMPWAVSLLPLT